MRKAYHIVTTTVFVDDPTLPSNKICPVCQIDKPLDQYSVHKGGRYEVRCKECIRTIDRERNHKRRPLKREPKIKTIFNPPALAEKRCSECRKMKLLSNFPRLKSSPDRRAAECKTCREQKRSVVIQRSLFFKVCPDCGIEKSLESDFYKHSRGGYYKYCKQCDNQHSLQWHYDHPEQVGLRNMKRQSNPAYIEYHREKERTRYNTLPQVAEQTRERARAWREENPLRHRENNRRREARKQSTQTSRVSYKNILERDGYFCYICEKVIDPSIEKGPGKLVFDHVIPLVPRPGEPQGSHSMENIRPSHHICNSRKKNKPFHLLTSFDRQGI